MRNGVNKRFETSMVYIPGTVRAWVPLLQPPSFVTEIGGRAVDLAEAPKTGDVVLLWYEYEAT